MLRVHHRVKKNQRNDYRLNTEWKLDIMYLVFLNEDTVLLWCMTREGDYTYTLYLLLYM